MCVYILSVKLTSQHVHLQPDTDWQTFANTRNWTLTLLDNWRE